MWFVFALGSAVFAALTSILAKIGIDGVNSTLATAIRTAVVLLMSWGMVFLTGTQTGIGDISHKSWLFLILSGLATGASWLCYYHALQIGAASKVVPIDKLSVVITLALAFFILRFRSHCRAQWSAGMCGTIREWRYGFCRCPRRPDQVPTSCRSCAVCRRFPVARP